MSGNLKAFAVPAAMTFAPCQSGPWNTEYRWE